MQIEMKSPESLLAYKNNARTHSGEQIEELIKSIDTFGFNDPIEIDEGGTIISGHARAQAAIKAGIKEVPTVTLKLSESKRKAYILAANRIAQNAGWDSELLKIEVGDLFDDDFDLGLTGFTADEIEAYLNPEVLNAGECDEDEVGEAPADPITKPGDIWICGNHRVACGDSTNPEDVDRLLAGSKIDLIFTDPPYGINEKGDRTKRNGENSLQKGVRYKDFIDDSTQYAIDAYNLCSILDIPVQIWFGANYYCHSLPESNNWLVWDKRVEENQRDFNSDCELAWVKSPKNSVRIFRHLWKGLMKDSERGHSRVHPTQKPIALIEWVVQEYEPQAKNILDLFGGSGSTLIACEKLGRKCFMQELDPVYIDVIVKRWQKFTGLRATLESTGQEFNSND